MAEEQPGIGTISWIDLTVENASEVREFYEQVVGWTSEEVEMGGYDDFMMQTAQGDTIAGICHARGPNEGLPPQWMVYITVADLESSVAQCRKLGGEVLLEPRQVGSGQCAIIRDPGGACVALYQSG